MTDRSDNPVHPTSTSYPWDVMLRDLETGGTGSNAFDFLGEDDIDHVLGLTQSQDGRSGKAAIAESGPESSGFSPGFRIFVDTLAETVTRNLRHLVAGIVQVSPLDAATLRLGPILSAIPVPSLIAVVRSEDLGGSGLMIIETPLAHAYFDMILGGADIGTSPAVSQRPFSGLEIKLFQKMAECFCLSLGVAIRELVSASFSVDRIETMPRSLRIGAATEQAVRIRLQITLGRRSGVVSLVFPALMLAKISSVIWTQQDPTASQSEDPNWQEALVRGLAKAHVPLDVMLAKFELPLREVMALKPGQTIPLELDPSSRVSLRSGGHILASGMMGRSRNHVAIRLVSGLSRQTEGDLS